MDEAMEMMKPIGTHTSLLDYMLEKGVVDSFTIVYEGQDMFMDAETIASFGGFQADETVKEFMLRIFGSVSDFNEECIRTDEEEDKRAQQMLNRETYRLKMMYLAAQELARIPPPLHLDGRKFKRLPLPPIPFDSVSSLKRAPDPEGKEDDLYKHTYKTSKA